MKSSRRVIVYPEEVATIVDYLYMQAWSRLEAYPVEDYEVAVDLIRSIGPPPPMSNERLAAIAGVMDDLVVRGDLASFYPQTLAQLLATEKY